MVENNSSHISDTEVFTDNSSQSRQMLRDAPVARLIQCGATTARRPKTAA